MRLIWLGVLIVGLAQGWEQELSLDALQEELERYVEESVAGGLDEGAGQCGREMMKMVEGLGKMGCLEKGMGCLKEGMGSMKEPFLMMDSWGRPLPGLTQQGQFLWFGDYAQCIGTRVPPSRDLAKYCMVHSTSLIESAAARNSSDGFPLVWKYGICVPPLCTQTDIMDFITNVKKRVTKFTDWRNRVPSQLKDMEFHVFCPAEVVQNLKEADGAIAFMSITGLFIMLALIGTGLDWGRRKRKGRQAIVGTPCSTRSRVSAVGSVWSYKSASSIKRKAREPEWWLRLLYAFSLRLNLKWIFKRESGRTHQIRCLFGIRVLSMFWVISGHSYLFALPHVGNVAESMGELRRSFLAQIILNASLSVDSFFLLSGTLTGYLWLTRMRKSGRKVTNPKAWLLYYFHRLLRLTPSYFYVLFLAQTTFRYLGGGPLWEPEKLFGVSCDTDDWWKHMLYISNFFPGLCLPWMWYLAVDFQFHIVSPVFLCLLFKKPRLGSTVCWILIVASGIARGVVVIYHHLPPNFLLLLPSNRFSPDMEKLFRLVYAVPHMRIGPYLMGILLGNQLSRTENPMKTTKEWSRARVGAGWFASFGLLFWACFGGYPLFQGYSHPVYTFLLSGFARTAWAAGLSLLIYLCHSGRGWAVAWLLSSRGWHPPARLTYAAYLTHELLLVAIFHSLTRPIFFNTHLQVIATTLGYIVLSFGAALILSVFIEYPPMAIERLLFRRPARHNPVHVQGWRWREDRTVDWVRSSQPPVLPKPPFLRHTPNTPPPPPQKPRRSVSFSPYPTVFDFDVNDKMDGTRLLDLESRPLPYPTLSPPLRRSLSLS